MKANQLYAVETFGGAGGGITGYVTSKVIWGVECAGQRFSGSQGESSHFMLSPYYEQFSRLLSANGKRTLSHILKRFSTMPFAGSIYIAVFLSMEFDVRPVAIGV